MNLLDTSPISPTARFPIKSGTLDFLQNGTKELIAQIMISQIGPRYSTSAAYVLYGCVASVSGPNTNISEGAIFFNGEILYSPAQVVPTPGGGGVICVNRIYQAYTTNADPVTFTNSSVYFVHKQWRAIYFASTPGGGNICDYVDLEFAYVSGADITSFYPDWTAVAAPQEPKCTVTPYGIIQLSGQLVTTGTPPSALIATLPAGFHPAKDMYFVAPYYNPTTWGVVPIVISSGIIAFANTADKPTGTSWVLVLDGITYLNQ